MFGPLDPVQDAELLARAAAHLSGLGPFLSSAPRDRKWRTTEQIAADLGLPGHAVDQLGRTLRLHEARCLAKLRQGLPSGALVRRAKYPDRTTALPLWGSVDHHGEPWIGLDPNRGDPPDDLPPLLRVPAGSPTVFLSHAQQDADLALSLAGALAELGIGAWRFQTHIDHRQEIAKSVRRAIRAADGVIALVTRSSIVSLWVLTELHTALRHDTAVGLVVDTGDSLLLRLFASANYPNPAAEYDPAVRYDPESLARLACDFANRETPSRAARYQTQARNFLASLPRYLGETSPNGGPRIWRRAFAFPHAPRASTGKLTYAPLPNLREWLPARPHPR